MKRIKNHTIHLEVHQLALVLLLLGIVIGALYANLFQDGYLNELKTYNLMGLDQVITLDINYGALLKYVLVKNFKAFFLIWIFSVTILGIPFMILYILYNGFSIGFLVSICTMQFGFKGIIVFLGYIFPQYLIYIPIYILTLSKGYSLCNEMYYTNNGVKKGKMSLFIERIIPIIFLAILLFIGSIVETYANTYFVQKVSLMILN